MTRNVHQHVHKPTRHAIPQTTRRDFLGRVIGLASGAAAASALPWSAIAQPDASGRALPARRVFDFREIKPGLLAIFELGGNAVLLINDRNKALLSDCKHVHAGYTLRREIEAQGYAFEKIVNTHHHLDHSGGNHAFTDDLELIAHANLTPRVRAQTEQAKSRARRAVEGEPGAAGDAFRRDLIRFEERIDDLTPDDFAPSTEMADAEMDVRLGEHVVNLRYVTNAHTDNDVFLYFPAHNVMHTGDLLFHELHPFIDVGAGATTRGWQQCLEVMIKRCDSETIVVPGHGEITDVDGLKGMSKYFDQLRDVVSKAMKEGRSREEITQMRPDVFAGRGFERMLPANLGVVHDELRDEKG